MSIEQKAREIARQTFDITDYSFPHGEEAARLGIIEGRRQAFEEAAAKVKALWLAGEPYSEVYDHIRALIEEQRPLGVEFEAVWDANTERLYEP